MQIGILTVDFVLEACYSLKDKRRRLSGLKDRFGRQAHLAVCESAYQDDHRRAQWSFIAAAGRRDVVEQTLQKVESYLDQNIDARMVAGDIEFL